MSVKFSSDIPHLLKNYKNIIRKNGTPYMVVFFLIGAMGIVITSLNTYRGIQSSSWHFVYGEVLTMGVSDTMNLKSGGSELRVNYRYRVDRKEYKGHRLSFTKSYGYSDKTKWDYGYKQYPVHSKVKVFYNPDDPSDSVLEPGISWHILFWFLFSSLSLVIAYKLKKRVHS